MLEFAGSAGEPDPLIDRLPVAVGHFGQQRRIRRSDVEAHRFGRDAFRIGQYAADIVAAAGEIAVDPEAVRKKGELPFCAGKLGAERKLPLFRLRNHNDAAGFAFFRRDVAENRLFRPLLRIAGSDDAQRDRPERRPHDAVVRPPPLRAAAAAWRMELPDPDLLGERRISGQPVKGHEGLSRRIDDLYADAARPGQHFELQGGHVERRFQGEGKTGVVSSAGEVAVEHEFACGVAGEGTLCTGELGTEHKLPRRTGEVGGRHAETEQDGGCDQKQFTHDGRRSSLNLRGSGSYCTSKRAATVNPSAPARFSSRRIRRRMRRRCVRCAPA